VRARAFDVDGGARDARVPRKTHENDGLEANDASGLAIFYAPTPLARLEVRRPRQPSIIFLATNEPRPEKTEAHFVIRAGLSRNSRRARRVPRVLAETRRLYQKELDATRREATGGADGVRIEDGES
jgi:hypothetical protein